MAEAATLRHLPADAVQRVCTFLAIRDIARLACTCSSLRQTCLDDRRVWRPRFEREFAATPVNGAQWIVPRSGHAAHRGVSTDDDIDVQAWPAQDYRCGAATGPCLPPAHTAVYCRWLASDTPAPSQRGAPVQRTARPALHLISV